MRLSEWRTTPLGQKVMSDKVAAAYEPALAVLGVPPDPVTHVVWGDEPDIRYQILAASDAGLVFVHVRVNVPQEGPRASAKLVRWNRLVLGETSAEAHHGHRFVTGQIETVVIKGADETADEVGAFLAHVLARIDGRVSDASAGGKAPKQNARSIAALVPVE